MIVCFNKRCFRLFTNKYLKLQKKNFPKILQTKPIEQSWPSEIRQNFIKKIKSVGKESRILQIETQSSIYRKFKNIKGKEQFRVKSSNQILF